MARILLVEDDRDQLVVRRLVLETAGAEVLAARSAAAAWRAFCAAEPDIVVMDLRLPRSEDGLALIRKLRQRSVAVRIIVLSGWTADLAGRPERALVDECLAKPIRSRQLLALIAPPGADTF